MTGINVFVFNHETMREIVQHYLDSKMLVASMGQQAVTAVTYNVNSGEFSVIVQSEPALKTEQGKD